MSKKFKYIFIPISTIIICLMVVWITVRAGDLDPSASPAGTMHSLLEMAAKDVNNTFDRATDSLEAIRDYLSSNLDTTVSSRAPSDTALSTTTWTTTRADYLDFLNSDAKYLISSSTTSTDPVMGSIAYYIGSSTVATSTDTLFGWLKNNYDYTAPSSTALTTNTWTDSRAGYLDAIAQSSYDSSSISANEDGNILEILKYLNNRSMFSVVNQKNGSAGANVADSAFYTQDKGGVDDYNNNGTRPTDSFSASWTQCTAANNYCKTGDSTACAGDVCYQDNNTGLIWSDYMGSGGDYTQSWFWANNCWTPGSWANPGACSINGDDACQCVKATSTPDLTGCEALGDNNWRLPHQKELMQAYIDGSWYSSTVIPHAGIDFWSATTLSNGTRNAWYTTLSYGYTNFIAKTTDGSRYIRCVR